MPPVSSAAAKARQRPRANASPSPPYVPTPCTFRLYGMVAVGVAQDCQSAGIANLYRWRADGAFGAES